jgi:multiple sugar transport system substrate-binding protein
MNDLIEEFNNTRGKEQGIFVTVTSVSNSDAIHDTLVASAQGEPGAGALPDLFVCYPKTALTMGPDQLVDWNDYFTPAEREDYVTDFLTEGQVGGRQIVFPIAKSSEVLFLNKTIFDRFSAATGVSLASLVTWEGMYEAMARYYEWTDALTPEVLNDGKFFFMYDSLFYAIQLTTAQLGGEFFIGERINFDDPALRQAWMDFASAVAAGYICAYEGYSTLQMFTGDVVCGIKSTASVLYFQDTVTYPDNTTEPLELITLPFPVYEGGIKTAVLRGGGLCALAGDRDKEAAAAVFCKWLTAAETNLAFVTQTGYMPVRKDAYQQLMAGGLGMITEEKYRSLYETIVAMYADYRFYVPPLFDRYSELEKGFISELKTSLTAAQESRSATPQEAAANTWIRLQAQLEP